MTGAPPRRVALFGATGTAGQGALRALLAAGHEVTCILRAPSDLPSGAQSVIANVTQPLVNLGKFDVVVSCLASRTGSPQDAWAIDHGAQMNVLGFAKEASARQFILLSAICVQKPQLPFQHAKLAFEAALIASGLSYSIVRPTAFFKSLSGQLDRVRAGKPFLVFGDGRLTACKPISDDDMGRYIADCIDATECQKRILPIGGPGPAITPADQAAELSRLMGREVKMRHVPVAMLGVIQKTLRVAGWISPKAAEKAQLARIGQYYATESMLVWDSEAGHYDAEATPSTGSETLFDFYADVIAGRANVKRGDHSVF